VVRRKRPPRGSRPGASGAREAIADAARQCFAEAGYDRAGIRAVAERAGVDPALVMHYFGSKQKLFVSVMALPYVPEEVLPDLVSGPRGEVGERLARFVVETLGDPQSRAVLTGMVRAAAAEPEIASLVREQVSARIVDAIAAGLLAEDAPARASLVASQIIGLIMARYVIRVEPLASLGPDALVAALAPNLQRYLTGPLSGDAAVAV
jgi:AcrR family transcriptional regulator